jgi:hypothetical protein
MKKLLPILFGFIFIFTALLTPAVTFAQNANQQLQNNTATDSRWVIDPEVTFIGKNARRSGDLLNWTLQNYNWVCVKQVSASQCDNSNNPIAKYWSLIVLYIVVPMLFVVILATSIVIIITRGKSLTIMRFIPRFIAVVLLIVFSYSLIQFFYQFTDLIQGFFLRTDPTKPCPPNCISDANLLYVGWSYNNFVGLRLLGDKYAESAFTSLLLTKLTALTYFVMVFLLLVRKIILWFFIIVSPIFPILLLYYPVRNTGKIWIGEFFRWLLYAPLFAIFLNGLVFLWKSQIPLVFPTAAAIQNTPIEYPTAVNILLGGPQQVVSPNNSVNLPGTFALYVVSLIMLWIVILLPWILLQIFLDYAQNFSPGDTAVMKTLVNIASRGGGGSGPSKPSGGGAVVSMPFAKKFSIPTGLKPGPTGAAKEIKAEHATVTNATFNRPAFIPSAAINNASVNASVLNAANVKLPSMRDIARFDVALNSNDVSKLRDVNRYSEQLVKIANPIVVTNTIERDHVKEVREKIVQQSQRGNTMASSVLSAAHASSRNISNLSNEKVKNALKQISNPASAPSTNREKMTQLNNMLKNESSKNKNQLASAILSVNDKTSDKEVQRIKEQLTQTSGSSVSKAVTSAVTQSAKTSDQVQTTLKQLSNPNSVTRMSDKEQVTKLRGTLEKASREGNQLATSILAVNDKTSASDIEALQQKIQEAKEKGEPVATEVSSVATETNATTLPKTNRIQTVKQEDYQAVKDMWKQNYQNMEVPQGMAGTRTDMIKDDIKNIDEIIGLLSSTEEEKVQQGMDQVSNLLPFLLVGGFSQNEIVSYLKAKQDAAEEVSKQLAIEEEEKVSVGVKTQHAQAQQTMAATMQEPSDTGTSDEEESESPLNNIGSQTPVAALQNQEATDVLKIANLQMPKIQDIARFETQALSADSSKGAESNPLQTVLAKIADPATITDQAEREQYEKIRETLLSENQKGNVTARAILSAAQKTKGTTPDDAKHVLTQIANPSLSTTEKDKKRFTQLHESLTKASSQGNALATEILSTRDATSLQDIEKLKDKLRDANKKGEPVAASVLPDIATPEMPDKNELQSTAKEDYDEVQKMWEENYRTLPVPAEYGSDRSAWISADKKYVEETIAFLTAPETDKQQEGDKRVSTIMPMLLLGGFSMQEVTSYLTAKVTAATTVLAELQKEEETKVAVPDGESNVQENAQKAEVSEEDQKEGES